MGSSPSIGSIEEPIGVFRSKNKRSDKVLNFICFVGQNNPAICGPEKNSNEKLFYFCVNREKMFCSLNNDW